MWWVLGLPVENSRSSSTHDCRGSDRISQHWNQWVGQKLFHSTPMYPSVTWLREEPWGNLCAFCTIMTELSHSPAEGRILYLYWAGGMSHVDPTLCTFYVLVEAFLGYDGDFSLANGQGLGTVFPPHPRPTLVSQFLLKCKYHMYLNQHHKTVMLMSISSTCCLHILCMGNWPIFRGGESFVTTIDLLFVCWLGGDGNGRVYLCEIRYEICVRAVAE